MSAPQVERSSATRARAGTWVALALVVAAAWGLRAVGIDYLLPHQIEPDSPFEKQAEVLAGDFRRPERFAVYGKYPHLVPWVLALAPAAEPGRPEAGPARPLGEHLEEASRERARTRGIVALLSLLLIPATYWIARPFVAQERWRLFAAALAGASLLHLTHSVQARPHAAAGALAALAVAAAMRLRRRRDLSSYALAALAAAAAVGALHSGIAVLVPIAVAQVWPGPPRRSWWKLVLPLAAVAASIWFFYPFLSSDAAANRATMEIEGDQFTLGGHPVPLHMFNGKGFATVLYTLYSYDPWMLLLLAVGLAGALLALRRRGAAAATPVDERASRRGDLAVALSYALAYLVVIGLYERTYQRFVIPLVPFVAAGAALGARWIAAPLARRGRAAELAALGLLALPTLAPAAKWTFLRTRPDTSERLADWIRAELDPAGATVLLRPVYEVPLYFDAGVERHDRAQFAGPRTYPWFRYQARVPVEARLEPGWRLLFVPFGDPRFSREFRTSPRETLRALGVTHVVIADFINAARPPEVHALREAARRFGELCARLTPRGEDDALPLAYLDRGIDWRVSFALRVLRARALGPAIEVYELAP